MPSPKTTRPIQVLPEQVIHKIAAGEVVERPVSVVKELVENSIDAGATQIHVEIEQGGLKSIVVTDNGCGIPPQELAIALKRHATSKITRAEELFNLHTLGFRGEALPSIASVSDFKIESATEQSTPLGYFLEMKEGKLSGLQETPMPRGTRISVKNLFCTTPARLKFLKRPETEWGHVYDLIMAMALSHPSIEWRLDHQGKKSLFCPATTDSKKRILDFFGKEVMDALYPLERTVSEAHISGLISHPNFSKKSNRHLFIFVNGRAVQDRLIQHAIMTGYRGLLMTQQYPMVVLNLQVDPQWVDVNVHPAKREVRFSNSNVIHHLISETIRMALEKAPWKETTNFANQGTDDFLGMEKEDGRNNISILNDQGREGVQQALSSYMKREWPEFSATEKPLAKIGNLAFSDLQLIGQLHQTYLVCSSQGSLILIDQHAAHERIGYENLKQSYLSGNLSHQTLLQPLSFNLNQGEAQRLRQCLTPLEKFGFMVDEFGENTFVLKAHPTLLPQTDWVALLKDVATEMVEEASLQSIEERLDHVLATMACHRQVRAGDRLKDDEMRGLLKQLEGTPRSYHCPHGRPVMVEIESREIEKWFKRVL